jgi:hypothetical protein
MKYRYKFTAALWLCLALLQAWAFFAHGRLIGGVQWFLHVGLGGAAAAQLTLIVGSLFLAWAVLVQSPAKTKIALAVAIVALMFALSFWLSLPIIRFLGPMVYPLGSNGFLLPVAVLFCATCTALLPLNDES